MVIHVASPAPARVASQSEDIFGGSAGDSEILVLYAARMAVGLSAVLASLRVLKFTSFLVPAFRQLPRLLALSVYSLWIFSIQFFGILIGGAYFFYATLGSSVDGYGTFHSSLLSLLRALFGDFDMEAILKRSERPTLGYNYALAILFTVYLWVGVFVLVSVFVSILNDAWTVVQDAKAEGLTPVCHEMRVMEKVRIPAHSFPS